MISVHRVSKAFSGHPVLEDVSLEIPPGELVALLGPSGSGKTTLLRLMAGLETPDAGEVSIGGPRRRVGFGFQHYALFKHMTVAENVAFGLEVRPRRERLPKAEIRGRVREVLAKVHLEALAERHPDELSGGQRQRVALARALAVEPEVLLLDEPFGALDAQVRAELRQWLRHLHDETGLTSVFVTHDQEEALELADRVVVLHRGRIEQVGTPSEIYEQPATPFVYRFIGQVNLFHGRVRNGVAHVGGVEVPVPEHHHVEDAPATAFLRPHEVALGAQPSEGAVPATVRRIQALGPLLRVQLQAGPGRPFEAQAAAWDPAFRGLSVGQTVYVRPTRLRVFLE